MSLVKLAYFGKDSQGHASTGAKVGAGLAAAGIAGLGIMAHHNLKSTGGLVTSLKNNLKPMYGNISNSRLAGAAAVGAGATIGASALVGGAAGSLVRTKKPGQV